MCGENGAGLRAGDQTEVLKYRSFVLKSEICLLLQEIRISDKDPLVIGTHYLVCSKRFAFNYQMTSLQIIPSFFFLRAYGL